MRLFLVHHVEINLILTFNTKCFRNSLLRTRNSRTCGGIKLWNNQGQEWGAAADHRGEIWVWESWKILPMVKRKRIVSCEFPKQMSLAKYNPDSGTQKYSWCQTPHHMKKQVAFKCIFRWFYDFMVTFETLFFSWQLWGGRLCCDNCDNNTCNIIRFARGRNQHQQ